MRMNEAKAILEVNGYTVEEKEVRKNGQLKEALTVGDGNIRPSIYRQTLEGIETEEQLLELIRGAMQSAPDVSEISDMLMDPEYVLENCYSCIRPATDDDKSVTFPVYGGELEEYIRIPVGRSEQGSMSTILNQDMMERTGLEYEKVRKAARENLRKRAVVAPMDQVLAEMMGREDLDLEIPEEAPIMLVASTSDKCNGAGVILLDDYMNEICERYGWEAITIIPSSIHECLFLPRSEFENEDEMNAMIREVNETQVAPEDRLGEHIYHFYAA